MPDSRESGPYVNFRRPPAYLLSRLGKSVKTEHILLFRYELFGPTESHCATSRVVIAHESARNDNFPASFRDSSESL